MLIAENKFTEGYAKVQVSELYFFSFSELGSLDYKLFGSSSTSILFLFIKKSRTYSAGSYSFPSFRPRDIFLGVLSFFFKYYYLAGSRAVFSLISCKLSREEHPEYLIPFLPLSIEDY
jgi:hypothetical protein